MPCYIKVTRIKTKNYAFVGPFPDEGLAEAWKDDLMVKRDLRLVQIVGIAETGKALISPGLQFNTGHFEVFETLW